MRGGMGRTVLVMPGQELGEIRRRKRLQKLGAYAGAPFADVFDLVESPTDTEAASDRR